MRMVTHHSSSSSVIRLAWSASGKYLTSGDDSGKVIVKRLEPPTPTKTTWAVYPVFEMRFEEAISTFLFSSREDFLLVSGPTTICVLALKTKTESARKPSPIQNVGVWANHASNSTILIAVNETHAKQFFWSTLDPVPTISHPIDVLLNPLSSIKSMNITQQTTDVKNRWLALETVPRASTVWITSQSRHIELMDLNSITHSKASPQPRCCIEGFAKHVRHVIGNFHDRIVFLDHQFWLCAWEIEAEYRGHKRHFPLPQDWLSRTTLRLMVVNKQGTFLCPKNGEVAVLRSGLSY